MPLKLVHRIKAGKFIDMAEFLSDCIGNITPASTDVSTNKRFDDDQSPALLNGGAVL